MTKSILIGGTGRSGSNLLKEVLSKDKNVASLEFEPRYILDPDGIIDFYNSFNNWSPYLNDIKLRRLFKLLDRLAIRTAEDVHYSERYSKNPWDRQKQSPPQYYNWELDAHIPGFSERVQSLKNELEVFDFKSYWVGTESFSKDSRSLFSSFQTKNDVLPILKKFIYQNIESFLKCKNRKVFVDDSTFNILHAKSLYELIDNSYLIHIYRDPKDVISSLKEQTWAPSKLPQLVLWYKSVIKRWTILKSTLPKEYYIEIKFEHFIQNPLHELSRISNLTGLEFSLTSNEFDFSKHNIGRSKKYFTVEEHRYLEDNLKDEITAYGEQ